MQQDKFLLIKERTGMSNRILNLMGGILYAKITQRKVIIDWSDEVYSPDRSNVFSQLFTLTGVDQATEIPETDSVYPPLWRGQLAKSVEEVLISEGVNKKENLVRSPLFWSRYRANIARLYDETVLIKWSYFAEIHKLRRHFKREFNELKYLDDEAIVRALIKKHLILNSDVQQHINTFKSKYFSEQVIGIHVRFTDRKNPFDHYPKLIDAILSQNPEAQLFLATDNLSVQEFFGKIYGDRVVLTEKWFPPDTTVMERLHLHPSCPDVLENGIQALVDLYLLASCDYLICDQNSTFAYVAELISDIPPERVFDTSRKNFKRKLKKLVHFMERWL